MLKRAMDLAVSAVLLVALSPLLLAVALWIKLTSPGPVFYRGVRVGRFGTRFRIMKFRTMRPDAPHSDITSTANDDPRITPAGRILRRCKLDELPQLLNVLRGEMSLVGPRPQVPWAVALYTQEERALLSVRPGMTDYASIVFSNEGELLRGSSDPDAAYLRLIAPGKNRLGLAYIKNRSLGTDCKLLFATFWRLLGGRPLFIPNENENQDSPAGPTHGYQNLSHPGRATGR